MLGASFLSCSKKSKVLVERVQSSQIICTTEILEDVVKRIAGDSFHVEALIRGNMDPHSYELVKGEIEKLEQAEVVFSNGLGLEHGSSLSYFLHKSKKVVPLGEVVWNRQKDHFIMIDGVVDPHFWMDVPLFAHVIDPIVEKLSKLKPSHQHEFEERAKVLKKAFCQLDQNCLELIDEVPLSSRYLVTSHDAFNYFVRRYLAKGSAEWKEHVMAPQGLAPEAEISLLDIQKVCDFMINQQVEVLFTEKNISYEAHRKIKEICYKKGHKTRLAAKPLFGDTLDKKSERAGSYFGMVYYNTALIVEELLAGSNNKEGQLP